MTTIRKYRQSDARAVSALISRTYAGFNSKEGTKKAVDDYVEAYNPKGKKTADIHARFQRTPNCFVAVSEDRIVGVVRGIENSLINLFVQADYHRQGIATRLMRKFENYCVKAGFSTIVTRASLYAVPFYQAIGYKKTTGIRNLYGLKVQSMRKRLS